MQFLNKCFHIELRSLGTGTVEWILTTALLSNTLLQPLLQVLWFRTFLLTAGSHTLVCLFDLLINSLVFLLQIAESFNQIVFYQLDFVGGLNLLMNFDEVLAVFVQLPEETAVWVNLIWKMRTFLCFLRRW